MILKDKTVLVTGTYSGIGLATAKYCLEQGARVIANVKEQGMVDSVRKELSSDAIILPYNVSDIQATKAAFQTISEVTNGQLHGLVNNAGILVEKSYLETELEEFDEAINVNAKAGFHHMQLAARLMIPNQYGSIVNICSYVGAHGAALFAAYSATKGAIESMTKSIAKELGGDNIRVNGVAPGFIESNMTAHYLGEVKEALMTRVTMGRPGKASEVASVIGFLLSEQSTYVSGHILNVDGAAFF